MTETQKRFAKRETAAVIKKAMIDNNVDVNYIVRVSKVPRSTVYDILRDPSHCRFSTLMNVARCAGVKVLTLSTEYYR